MMMKFLRDESGATAIEYGLIAGMFGVTMAAAFSALGDEYIRMYANIEDAVIDANSP